MHYDVQAVVFLFWTTIYSSLCQHSWISEICKYFRNNLLETFVLIENLHFSLEDFWWKKSHIISTEDSDLKERRLRQRRELVFLYVCVFVQPLYKFSVQPYVQNQIQKYRCLHNSLYQESPTTFICFYIDNEDNKHTTHKI